MRNELFAAQRVGRQVFLYPLIPYGYGVKGIKPFKRAEIRAD
jgi:hypothetical protein